MNDGMTCAVSHGTRYLHSFMRSMVRRGASATGRPSDHDQQQEQDVDREKTDGDGTPDDGECEPRVCMHLQSILLHSSQTIKIHHEDDNVFHCYRRLFKKGINDW